MKKIWFILVFLGLSFLPVQAQEPVEITHFNTNIVINENGLMQVDQFLDVQFNENRHGIYAYIPQSYDMVWNIDNQDIEKSYYFPVRKVRVMGDPYEIETDSYNNVVIKIGDADEYVYGPKSYHYSYTLQLRDLDLDGLQALYFNIVGEGWQLPIQKTSFTITLPKAWPTDIRFYTGLYGDPTDADIQPIINGNTLTATFEEPLRMYQALTIYAPLPNDYFTFIPPTDFSMIILGSLIALLLLTVFLYFKFGKDDLVVESVEFNPIPGLSSAQAGFVYDGFVDTKDILSLIIEWAYKGYLTITEEGKDDFTLTKLKDLDNTSIRAEQTLFNGLFKSGDIATKDSLKNTFYISLAHAKNDIYRYFQGNKERQIYSNTASVLKVIFASLCFIPFALLFANAYYQISYQGTISMIIAGAIFVFGSLISAWLIYVVKRWSSQKSALNILSAIGLFMVGGLYIIATFALAFYFKVPIWTYAFTLFLTLIILALVSIMDRRTELGIHYLGKLIGLKRFIETAEKDRLEMMVHDDPTYFYKILPYAYVLNVSDVWSKKFESIAIEQPDWYVGSTPHLNSYLFMRSFSHTLSSMNQVMTSIPQSSGKGGGGFGGGGGGFSGGGFGGGGGGSW